MYTIGKIKGLNQDEITAIKNLVEFVLPQDYLTFLSEYGFGEINEILHFQIPDKEFVRNNFSDYLYLWDWTTELQKESALNGLTIATTYDGDTVCCVDNDELPYLLLPRHSSEPIEFEKFTFYISDISDYFKKLKTDNLYFDTNCNREMKYISLIKNGQLDKELISKIHKSFLEKYQFDKVFNEDIQPKYIMQEIGGWVYFDLLNFGSSIRVKYQSMFEQKANEIIDFIEQQI